jgi:hypothetical protein
MRLAPSVWKRGARVKGWFFPFLVLLAMLMGYSAGAAQLAFDIETGLVMSGYNDVRIPGDTGTLFSLSEELDLDPSSFFRVRILYELGGGHSLGLLVAPLRLEGGGTLNRPVLFQDQEFPPAVELQSRYRFDSYRLTYRFDFHRDRPLQAGLGFTAKVRDASIRLKGDGRQAEKKNTGLVPLVNFRLYWMMANELGLLLEGDALAAPQGRAEDVLLALCFWPNRRIGMKAGFRILEGGADNDEVYTFALLHYLVAGAMFSF